MKPGLYAVGLINPATKDDICDVFFTCPTVVAAKELASWLNKSDAEDEKRWSDNWKGGKFRWAYRKIAADEDIFKKRSLVVDLSTAEH